jgi:hypothetical protein
MLLANKLTRRLPFLPLLPSNFVSTQHTTTQVSSNATASTKLSNNTTKNPYKNSITKNTTTQKSTSTSPKAPMSTEPTPKEITPYLIRICPMSSIPCTSMYFCYYSVVITIILLPSLLLLNPLLTWTIMDYPLPQRKSTHFCQISWLTRTPQIRNRLITMYRL